MPSAADIRKQFPSMSGLSDEEVVDALQRNFYQDMPREKIAQSLGVKLAEPKQEEAKSGVMRRVLGDSAVSLVKGAVSVPEAAVGLADLATGGRAGKVAEDIGFRPKEAKAILDQTYSEDQKQAFQAVHEADGFGATVQAALENPSTIGHTVLESAPSMGAGGVIGRGLLKVAPKVAPSVAGAVGEGAVAAGAGAEAVRQESPDGLLNEDQSIITGGSGATTAAISMMSGALQRRLGLGDVDALLAQGLKSADPLVVESSKKGLLESAKKGVVRKVVEGAVTEGMLEELPQSVQEQVAQNVALGKPWDEGVDTAAALGMLSGAVMGGAAAPFGGPLPGDPVREAKLPETGPMSKAVNAGIEGVAKDVDANAPLPAGMESTPVVAAPEFQGTTFGSRVDAVRTALADPVVRQQVFDTFGEQGLNEATYYANIADRPAQAGGQDAAGVPFIEAVPMRTREGLLGIAEQIVARAQAIRSRDGLVPDVPQPQPALPGPAAGPALALPPGTVAGTPGGQPLLPVDNSPSGTLIADEQGNVRPELRREVVNREARDTSQVAEQEARIADEQAQQQAQQRTQLELGTAPGQGAAPRAPDLGEVQDGDILNESGQPFRNKRAAEVVARREGGRIVAVPQGWVVRRGDDGHGNGDVAVGPVDAGAVPGGAGLDGSDGPRNRGAGTPAGDAQGSPVGEEVDGDGRAAGGGAVDDGGSATVADPADGGTQPPAEPAGEKENADDEQAQEGGQAPQGQAQPEGGDEAAGGDRAGGSAGGPGTPTGGLTEPGAAQPGEQQSAGEEPGQDGDANPTGGADGEPAGGPSEPDGSEPAGGEATGSGQGTPGGQPTEPKQPKEPKEPKQPREQGEKKPPKPKKTDQEKELERIAAMVDGANAAGLAAAAYKDIRDPEVADHPLVFPEDKLVRFPVKPGERVQVEANLEEMGFRITDRAQESADAERIVVSAVHRPKASIGDAGEQMGGGRKDQEPPTPKSDDEKSLDAFLAAIHPSTVLDPDANPDQSFGTMMFKEAIYSGIKYPLAYIRRRLNDNGYYGPYGASDKAVLKEALARPEWAPKVRTYGMEYRERLAELQQELLKAATVKDTLTAFTTKYGDENGLRWNGEAGAKLQRVYDKTFRDVLQWAEVFGKDEHSTDQTYRVKKKDPDKPPYLENIVRVGMKDHRGGRNVDEKDFLETFGWRGVEFGNWVTQDERQINLNLAYDSLMDMADLLGMSPKLIGMNGQLGMAIGARGRGGNAAAHFEPNNDVINLTKTKGNGTVSHEWFHALDFMLYKQQEGRAKSELRNAIDSLANALKTRTDIDGAVNFLRATLQSAADTANRNTPPKEAVFEAVFGAKNLRRYNHYLPNLYQRLVSRTTFYKNAEEMDSGKGEAYWKKPAELLARGFETYLFDETKGGSPYLVGPTRGDGVMTPKNGYQGTPYPRGDERQYVAGLYKSLLENIDGQTLQFKPYISEPRIETIEGLGFVVIDQKGIDPTTAGDSNMQGRMRLHEKRVDAEEAAKNAKGAEVYVNAERLVNAELNKIGLDFAKRVDAIMDEMGIIRWPEVRNGSMAESMFFHLRQGWWPENNQALKEYAGKAFRVDPKSLDLLKLKQAQEDFEAALARYAGQRIEDMRATGADDRAIYDYLVDLYLRQPNLDVRTSDSAANQAYSTPLPISFVTGLLTRVKSSQKLFDPTGGNGMLAIAGNPKNVITIELDAARANNMRLMEIGRVIEGNAVQKIDDDIREQEADVVHANPPFGSLPSPVKVPSWTGQGYLLGKIDHLIAAKAMKAMADKGRAVIILGAHKQTGTITSTDRVFLNWLYSNYHVADHFEIDGKLYSRQGAGWPIRVLVIAGRKQTVSAFPTVASIDRVYDFNQLWERYGIAAENSREPLVGAGKLPEDLRGQGDGDRPGGVQGGADGQAPGAGGGGQGGAGAGATGAGDAGSGDAGGQPGGSGQDVPGGGVGGGRGTGSGRGAAGGSTGGGASRRGAGDAGTPGLSGLSDDEIDRLLNEGASGASSSGGRSSGGGRGGAPRGPRTPKTAGGADKTVLDGIEGVDDIFKDLGDILGDDDPDPAGPGGGPRPAFSRKPVDDDKYGKMLPVFDRLWDALTKAIADIAQRIRRFAAGLKQKFGDAIVPYAARYLSDLRDQQANVPSGKKPIIADHGDTETMVVYRGRSAGGSGGIYVPKSQADALQAAFDAFEAKYGEVDPFVMKELGYDSIEQMQAGLGGYQIDALALAIGSMKEGDGFIIGDDTGVGKGRTAAGLITWAINQGKVPIFFSFKKDLYSDMWGDLRDIGKRLDGILMTDADGEIVDKKNDNKPILKNRVKQLADDLKYVAENGAMPAGKKALFSTFFQVQKDGMRARAAITALVKSGKAVIIMDESHNAAGDSNRADYIEGLLTGNKLFGVDASDTPVDPPEGWQPPPTVYLSATYAKRADNMPLYQRTHLRHAANSPDELVQLFKGGGDVLLKTASEMLVRAGSMIRRERSYIGVKFGFEVDEANAPRDARLVDEVTSVLRQIVYADRAFNEWAESAEGAEVLKTLVPPGFAVGSSGTKANVAMNKNPFTSIVHNYVGQLLLATKIQTSVEKAIESLNRGEKPVLTLQNTMEAALEDYAETENLKDGDELENFGWQTVLQRGLTAARRVSFKSGTGDKADRVRVVVPLGMIPGLIQREFARAQSLIDKFQSTLPASPIDAVKNELSKYWVIEKADGILVTKNPPVGAKARRLKVDEITGRGMMVDYSAETPRYRRRARPDTNDVVTWFQDGAIDVVLLNSSGSTGLSLHASEFARDQRPRNMIILQPNPDVSVFKQTIGRIHRTGQVEWPSFVVLATGIPAERRALAVMRKKLKTLFSNTSSGKGSTDLEATDFINEYGDKIVKGYLQENEDVAKFVGIKDLDRVDLALVAYGRAALLSVDEQTDFFDTVEQQFKDEIAMRDATGTNALERRELDLQAIFEEQNVLEEGMDETNPFTATAYISLAKINILGDVPTPEGVREAVSKALNGRKASEIVDAIEQQLKLGYDEALNQQQLALAELKKQLADPNATAKEQEAIKERVDGKERVIRDFSVRRQKTLDALRTRYYVGAQFDTVNIGDVEAQGVVVGITVAKVTAKGGNPYSPSHFRIVLQRNVPNGRVEVPLSKIENQTNDSDVQVKDAVSYRDNIDEWFALKDVVGGREERYIASGNLLRARAVLKGSGEMILHTMNGSTPSNPMVQAGIRLPHKWVPSATAASDFAIRYPGAAVDYVLAIVRAHQQDRLDSYGGEQYENAVKAIDGLTKYAPALTIEQAKAASDGLYGSNHSWTLKISEYGGEVYLSARDQAVATNKAVKSIVTLAKKRGRDWWTMDSGLKDPAKVAALVRALGRLGPVLVSSEHKDIVAPIVKSHFTGGKEEGDTPAMARSLKARPGRVDVGVIEQVVADATAKWGNAPKVVVVGSMSDQRIPASVRAEYRRQNEGGATGDPSGFINDGTVYLVASALESAAEARTVLMHETLGHYGLRGTFGAGLGSILDQIARAQPKRMAEVAKSYGLDLSKQDDRRIAAEEVLAFMAQNEPELGFVRRAIAAIRSFLRRIGWREVGLSNDEIVRDYILPARRFVEGGPSDGPKGGKPAAFRAPPAFNRGGLSEALAGAMNNVRGVSLPAGYAVNDFIQKHGKLSWWQKTVGTPYNLAEKSPAFKKVFDRVQSFLGDISQYATEAADRAPTILPKLDKLSDIVKTPIAPKDADALAAPMFQGTLLWKRDQLGQPELADTIEEAGVVWTDAELKDRFKLTDKQIGLYREARAAIDESVRSLAISDMLRVAGKDAAPLAETIMELDIDEAAQRITDRLAIAAASESAGRAAELQKAGEQILEKARKAKRLIERGYAPLSRYGSHAVDVVDADGDRLYFGLFETQSEANKMARKLRERFPDASVNQGTMATEKWKMFAGVSPETVELFGEILGLDSIGNDEKDKAFQEYIRLAKSNRSSMKRMLERKGVEGFSDDIGRVLAGFVYSNARQTAANLHLGEISRSVNEIPKDQGELSNYAVNMVDYVRNPVEEAQGLRSVLFAQYLGGSIASAMVNMTQPFAVAFPYLSQFGSAARAGKELARAFADMVKGKTGDAELDKALKEAEEEGVVSPQEIFQLMAQAQGRAALRSGDGTFAGDAAARINNGLSRLQLAWGKPFAMAELINRRATFIAAYRMAPKGQNPAEFAAKAVRDTQFVYNKGNRPRWARGVLGSLAFTFKMYGVSYVELMSRMAVAGPSGRKAFLLAMAMILLLGGADGLPFMQDADDVIDGIMQRIFGRDFSTKEKRRELLATVLGEEFAKFATRGFSGLPGAPIDVANRLGLGNLVPGTGVFLKKTDYSRDALELVGPVSDFIQRAFKSGGQLLQADSVEDVARADLTISPIAAQNWAKSFDMVSMGMYRDDAGRKVLDTTAGEALAKAVGFQPATVAQVQDSAARVQRSVNLARTVEQEIVQEWAQGLFEDNPKKVEQARARLQKWNRDNPGTLIRISATQIRRRVMAMREDRKTRLEKSAPAELRARVREEMA